MKIKRYTADSMRAALAQVRSEQGADAVILSSRRAQEGIEVIAAVDYDEALFMEAKQQRIPQPAAAAPARTDAGFSGAAIGLMPLKAQVLEQLTAMDIAPDVAMAIAEQTPRRTSLQNPANIPLALLIKHLPIGSDQTCVSGGITALVGPTGAGKTTTIAKLAARWCLAHGPQGLALVSTDAYRIGAREQLMTYARILDVPMYTANSGKELARLLMRLSSKKLVLIDTAGMGPRDVRLSEQLAALKLGAAKAKVLLALPAHGEGRALEEIVGAFSRAAPQACILTKVDEAASLGGVLSAAIRHKLKIAYLCNGQRVPEDMHAAEPRRVWLARAALHLKRGAPRVRDEARLARTSGRVHAHG